MTNLVVFDLDGTLAESKAPIDAEMVGLLTSLLEVSRVAVISGGGWPQFEQQLLAQLPVGDYLKKLTILPTCGTRYFQYDTEWKLEYSEDLTPEEGRRITEAFQSALTKLNISQESSWGPLIEDRGSQVTLSALGQLAPIAEKEAWDPDYSKRKAIKVIVDGFLPDLSVRIGGTTSIDVTRAGIDKGYGLLKLRDLLSIPIENMLFVGDALFPGGNDLPAKEAGAPSVCVRDPHETKRVIETILVLKKL